MSRAMLCALAALALACGLLGERPEAAARRFWDAVRAGDWEAARAASNAPDARRVEALFGARTVGAVSLGETLDSEDAALVETRVERLPQATQGPPPPIPAPLVFHTRLVRVEDDWRVDAEGTARELRTAALAAAFGDFGDSLHEGGQALGEAIERGAQEAAEALRRAVEELEQEPTAPPR